MKLGLIGGKLGHSASPEIHKRLFRMLDISDDMEYGLLEMDRNDIPNELKVLANEYTGMNVTIPYKLDVMPHLTEISEEGKYHSYSRGRLLRLQYGLYRFRTLTGTRRHCRKGQDLHRTRIRRCGQSDYAIPDG